MANIQEIRAQLVELGLSAETVEKTMKDMVKEHTKASVENVQAFVEKAIAHDKYADDRATLAGTRVNIRLDFDDDGNATVEAGLGRRGKRGGGGTGRKTVVVNGETYESAAAACRALELDYEGKSGVRVLEAALKNGEIDSLEFVDSE